MKRTFGSSWFELSFIVGVFIFLLGYGYYLRGLDRPLEIGLAFAIIFILLVLLQKKLEKPIDSAVHWLRLASTYQSWSRIAHSSR